MIQIISCLVLFSSERFLKYISKSFIKKKSKIKMFYF